MRNGRYSTVYVKSPIWPDKRPRLDEPSFQWKWTGHSPPVFYSNLQNSQVSEMLIVGAWTRWALPQYFKVIVSKCTKKQFKKKVLRNGRIDVTPLQCRCCQLGVWAGFCACAVPTPSADKCRFVCKQRVGPIVAVFTNKVRVSILSPNTHTAIIAF